MGSNVFAEILEAVCPAEWAVFPIVGLVHDKEREISLDAAIDRKAVNGGKLLFYGEEASEGQLRATAGRDMGLGYGYDSEAVVRSPGRCEGGVQPAKARTTFARVSQLFHCELTTGNGRGSAGRESDGGIVCAARTVVAAGWNAGVEP